MSSQSIGVDVAFNSATLPNGEQIVNISVVPPVSGERKPCAVIAAIDVSGSMGSRASVGDATDAEAAAFTRLDLVKHSMNSILGILSDQDYLSVVSFSNSARVVLPLTKMNEGGRGTAKRCVESLDPSGGTNIWAGLQAALEQTACKECHEEGMNTVVVLLTDGEPNDNPVKGIIPTYKEYIGEHPLTCTVHTFGFGYELDSDLLSQIATVGSGLFSYIPDCSMVGTVFVNFASNALSAITPYANLTVTPAEGTAIQSWVGLAPQPTSNKVPLGLIQYGQSRDIVLNMGKPGDQGCVFTVKLQLGNGQAVRKEYTGEVSEDGGKKALLEWARLHQAECIRSAFEDRKRGRALSESQDTLKGLLADLRGLPAEVSSDPFILALIRDVESDQEAEGQVGKSLSREDWFEKWGCHYLPSLVCAHLLQQCHNFKDPGVQLYGGSLFNEVRDKADEIFIALPPPKPSFGESYSYYSGSGYSGSGYSGSGYSAASAPSNMSYFYNASGGCFDGNALIVMADGSSKKVKDLQKGETLLHGANVVCVVETRSEVEVVDVNGLLITPWHPVKMGGQWVFPRDLVGDQPCQPLNGVVNLVLDSHHVVKVGGVEAITLGHGMTGPVVEHPYFGTQKVIEDLQKTEGWESGRVVCKGGMDRDAETGLVTRIY